LVDEADHISRISQHMMNSVHELLVHLRPAELDELGFFASLNSLVSGWNARSGGKIHYQLNITGDCTSLPEPLAVTLFRIVQECLTNIAKHSAVTNANVSLAIATNSVALTVTVREFEILRLLVEARTTEDISQSLNISTKTVCNCHYLIKRKLGVSSDIELTRLAIKLNVISLLDLSASVIPIMKDDRFAT
jgi:DNA-binding CsgD family transcriptional regulator